MPTDLLLRSNPLTIEDAIDYLEESTTGRFQRWTVVSDDPDGQSAWFCTECDMEHGECICDDADIVNEEEPCWL